MLGLICLMVGLPVTVVGSHAKPPAGAVASAHPQATAAGMEILGAGGNAFDAAVAVSAALAVVEPYGSGIGGGGFWLLHRASDGKQIMIDGRERAPLAAQRDLYLDEQGDVVPRLSMDGALAAAVPGEPAALAHLAEKYGRLPLAKSLAPAIRLAEKGFRDRCPLPAHGGFPATAHAALCVYCKDFFARRRSSCAGYRDQASRPCTDAALAGQ